MKKIMCVILAICMLLGIVSLAGCSNSDTASLREDSSNDNYEWEELFSTDPDESEVLTIYRRHSNYLIFHNTHFKVVVYKDGVCTHFYESTAVPCKTGFIPYCNEKQRADFKDGCEIDGVLAALLPHIETVYANRIIEDIIEGEYSGKDMAAELFINNMKAYFDDYEADLVTGAVSSGLGIVASYKDYASKIVEVVFGVDEAAEQFGETKDAEDAKEYARIIMPWLSQIEAGTKTSLNRILFENAKALTMLEGLSGRYAPGKIQVGNYKEEFDAVEDELINNFKTAMDDIDAQVLAEAEKKAEDCAKWWDDFWRLY